MRATNIQWDIDFDDVWEVLADMDYRKAADVLEIPYETYANMTTEERDDYAYDYFRHRPGALCDFLGLPDEVDIPSEFDPSDDYYEEDITDWLSDEYGYCINVYVLED